MLYVVSMSTIVELCIYVYRSISTYVSKCDVSVNDYVSGSHEKPREASWDILGSRGQVSRKTSRSIARSTPGSQEVLGSMS